MLPESLQFYVRAGGDIMVIEDERGLKPVSAEVFVPLLLRD
jgi:hypothetical protein